LKDRDWLVGNRCTIADIGCWGRMVFMAEGGFDIANWPHLGAWSRRLKAMPVCAPLRSDPEQGPRIRPAIDAPHQRAKGATVPTVELLLLK
jgi:glutathione S-transferase